jgi:PAS domain S-box-containing protein
VRWKPGGIRTFANEAYCRYFGLTPEQALSESFVPLIYEEDRQAVEEKISRLMSGITTIETETHRVIRPDGTIGWQEWTDQAIYDDGGQLIEFQSIGRDVTERKQVDEALYKSEERYRALFEDSPVSIWEEDFSQLKKQLDSLQAQGIADLRAYFISQPNLVYDYSSLIRILDVNKAAMHMYHANSKDELIKNSVQVLSKGEQENIVDDFIAIAEGRMSNGWEGGDETLLGEPIEISLKWLVAPGYEHDYSKVIVTVIDITERKRAESELQASEERFRQLAGNIQEVFWIKDAVAKKDLYISPAYEDVWGRRLEAQMENQNVFIESVLPEDREMVLATIEKQMQGKRTEMEYRITRPDGSIRWIWDRAFPIFDGFHSVKLVTGIAADITERKQAEAETLRHLAELQALYENGLAVGRLLSPQEIGERVIQTFTHYLSWHHVTIRLRRDGSDDLDLVAFSVPHLQEGEKENVERNFNARINKVGQGMSGWVVQTGEPVRTGNVRAFEQYVNTYDAIQSGMYMPLKIGNRVIGCISVESEIADAFTAQDERLFATIANQAAVAFENARLYQAIQQELFDRKHAEEMLELERNSLAQRVEDRTADLKRAIESLARALRVKDEFLANMSHELRTPLNAILGLSESLAEQVAGSLNDKQLKYVTTISESGHHLLALINDILDLAKIEAGQITLDITRVDMELVCQASLRMVKQLAQKKNQEIELEIDRDFGLIWADERRLKQMIVNLLSNAVKFTPENKRIGLEVHGDKDENRVLITVWDEGIGIEDDDLAQLFKPFVQLDAGLARETSGTGLGLALVAQMARLHGGGVSVASIPEQGSRFTIVIPWEPALRADTIERLKVTGKFKAVKTDQRHQPTILLIEDTKEVVMLLRDYLELAGYKVITAEDGIEGITQARLLKPDLILMDLQMPRMDGIETTQKLRSETEFKHTPIIALTALAMQGDRERCLAAGMDEYISKPVNLKALVKIIQGFLAGDSQLNRAEG